MTDDAKKKDEKGTGIGNFEVEVTSELEEITEAGKTTSVRFKIRFEEEAIKDSDEITVPLTGPKGLSKLNWYDVHPYIQIYPKLITAQQLLANDIRAQLPGAPKHTLYRVSHLGTSIIDGEAIYNTGGDLIRAGPPLGFESRHDIVPEPSKYKLDIDPTLSEAEAAAEMINIVRLSLDAGRVIFAHSLLYHMRKVYEAAWKSPCCILFLWGYTGIKKTTLSAFLTQLHCRGAGIEEPTRLNASIPAAEAIIYEKSDCVIVLDDLFPARFRDMIVQQEKTFLEITRIIADGVGRARMKGNQILQRTPTCDIIFTGEYLVGSGSDAARLLPINYTTPIDVVKLGECQAKPLVVSTFYNYFIKWYIENYGTILELLKQWWDKYRKTEFGVHDRLRETHFFLSTAYKIFLRYCTEKGFTSPETARAQHRSFEELLTKLVREQNDRIKQGEAAEPAKVDTFKLIRTLYKSDGLCLAKNKKRFDAAPEQYDGLLHKGLLCLRSEKLLDKFAKMGYSNSLVDIRRELIAKEALYLDGEDKNKKVGNTRFLGIHLSKLN